jgi:lipoprotein NlpD
LIKKSPVVVRDETASAPLLRSRFCSLVINILIILLLFSCSSHRPAEVREKSINATNRPFTHRVEAGDTLFSIAWRYGLKYEALAKYNGISAPYLIHPTQVIKLNVPAYMINSPAANSPVRPMGTRKKASQGWRVTKKATAASQKNQTKLTPKINLSQPAWGAPQWSWPVAGVILSSFQGNNGLNKGIDLSGKLGEPVLAAASGQVVYSGSGLRGYGKLLIVKHNETFLSAYAHNDRLLVKEGDLVKVGQRIADMGSSGTDRVKLHFEIRRDGTPVDPLKFLPRR